MVKTVLYRSGLMFPVFLRRNALRSVLLAGGKSNFPRKRPNDRNRETSSKADLLYPSCLKIHGSDGPDSRDGRNDGVRDHECRKPGNSNRIGISQTGTARKKSAGGFIYRLFVLSSAGFLALPHPAFAQFLFYHQALSSLGSAESSFRAGYLMEEKGDKDSAIRKYREAVKKWHAEAANRLAVLLEDKDLFEAIKQHEKAVAWDTKGAFSHFSRERNVSAAKFGRQLQEIPSPGAASALRLGRIFGAGGEGVPPDSEKSEEFYNKAYDLGVPAWVIGEDCQDYDTGKADKWLEKETEYRSLAMYLIGRNRQNQRKMEEAAEWYKKAVGESAALAVQMLDEESLALYKERVGELKPPSRKNLYYAVTAAMILGHLYYSHKLEAGGRHSRKETAKWFWTLADDMNKHNGRNPYREIAETLQARYERTKSSEDLKWTMEYYKLATGGHGFDYSDYSLKMEVLSAVSASSNNAPGSCQEKFHL